MPDRNNKAKLIERACEHCLNPFPVPPYRKKRFCSRSCVVAARKPTDPSTRFWSKVNKTESCWLWTGGKGRYGYGRLRVTRRHNVGAHQLSWRMHHGEIPDGLKVLHKCDNPPCVRPDHLFLGTQKENIHDAINKGRFKNSRTHIV